MATGEAGAAAAAPLFELDGVGYSVGDKPILTDVTLALEPGRIHGLIGPNGSGKSTLVNILARQLAATSGTVRFRGAAVGEGGTRAFARKLAYLPQTTPPVDGMSVEELVGLGRYAWHGALGRKSAADRAAVERALERARLDGFRGRAVDELSGGERQRVWFAMLLAQEAGCVVLDEPTSALDVSHQAEILALVRDLADTDGLSVVIVLHDINMAARICDRMIALKRGRVIDDDTPERMMAPGRLDAIFDVTMGVLRQPETGRPISYVA